MTEGERQQRPEPASRALPFALRGLVFDRRSLALTRAGAAVGVFACLLHRVGDLEALYADSGAFTRSALRAIPHPDPWLAPSWWSGHVVWQMALFALTAVAALGLFVGWRTRVMSALLWALLTSIEVRNVMVVSGADSLLSSILLIGVFVPWGERFSLDAAAGRATTDATDGPSFSVGALALALQAVLLFPLSALVKHGAAWETGEVLLVALAHDSLRVSPLGDWLLGAPHLVRGMSWAALRIEQFAWLVLFLPWTHGPHQRGWLRLVGMSLIACLMLGIAGTLDVGPFPVVTIALLPLFLPSSFWSTWLGAALQARLDAWLKPAATGGSQLSAQGRFLREVPAVWLVVFCASVKEFKKVFF